MLSKAKNKQGVFETYDLKNFIVSVEEKFQTNKLSELNSEIKKEINQSISSEEFRSTNLNEIPAKLKTYILKLQLDIKKNQFGFFD